MVLLMMISSHLMIHMRLLGWMRIAGLGSSEKELSEGEVNENLFCWEVI